MWVHVVDDQFGDVEHVPVTLNTANVSTGPDGLAKFEPLDAGNYTVSLAPLGGLNADYLPPAGSTRHVVNVRNGEITYVAYELTRRAELVVTVVHRDIPAQFFGRAVVSVSGAQPVARNMTDPGDGLTRIPKVKAGRYSVKATLSATDAATFSVPTAATDVTLLPGQRQLVTIFAIPRAKPVIEAPEKSVPVMRFNNPPRLTITLKADIPFRGKGILEYTGEDILIYLGGVATLAVGGKQTLEIDSVGNGVVVELEGWNPTAIDGVTLSWTLIDGAEPAVADPVTEKFTAVRVMLTVHDWGDLPALRSDQDTYGRVVHVQDPAGRRKRAMIKVAVSPADWAGAVSLRAGSPNVALFAGKTGGSALPDPYVINVGPGLTPAPLYVEGRATSSAVQDTSIIAEIVGLADLADWCNFTVIETWFAAFGPEDPSTGGFTALTDLEMTQLPGRELYVQGPQKASSRALTRVWLKPSDAPCQLQLRYEATALALYAERYPDKGEVAFAAPYPIPPAQIDPAEGFYQFWVEGKALATSALKMLRLDVPGVDSDTARGGFTVRQSKLKFVPKRHDLAPLSDGVVVEVLDKISGGSTLNYDYCGDMGSELELPPGKYPLRVDPQGDESLFRMLRTTPAGDLAAAINVEEVPEILVTYQFEPPPKYTHIQFIGFQIETGTYMGLDAVEGDPAEARKDILARCALMRSAIARGYMGSQKTPDTLKVFMAPEFYFRGNFGAYPLEMMSEVATELRKETDKNSYKDWVFVFGSVLGYLKLSDPETLPNITNPVVTTVTGNLFTSAATPSVGNDFCVYNTTTSAQRDTVAITGVRVYGKDRFQITMPPIPPPGADERYVFFEASGKGWFLDDEKLSVRLIRGGFTGDEIPVGAELSQGGVKGRVLSAVVNKGLKRCEIYADFAGAVNVTPITTNVLGKTEIFNVVPVQQGGGGTPMKPDGSRDTKELLIYKEYVSWVDFNSPDYGKDEFFFAHRHFIDIHGETRTVVPTQGSTDMNTQEANPQGQVMPSSKTGKTASEVSATGLGGGAVFEMAGMRFGVDVCLDHANKRLKNSGEAVHLHLVPSCGMSIEADAISVQNHGFVFNVDGQKGAAHTALQKVPNIAAAANTITNPAAVTIDTVTRAQLFPNAGKLYVYPRQTKDW